MVKLQNSLKDNTSFIISRARNLLLLNAGRQNEYYLLGNNLLPKNQNYFSVNCDGSNILSSAAKFHVQNFETT
jgi:hypothetical protein